MSIWFHSEIESLKIINKRQIKNWIKSVIQLNNYYTGTINIIITTDKDLLNINRKYLDHDYYTDIITFDYKENKKISGDIYISADRVEENSRIFNISFDDELKRVIIHGVLHLIGLKDRTKKQKTKMTNMENKYLASVKDLLITNK